MKHKFSKVFFVVAMLLVVCLFAVACNDGNDNNDNNDLDPVKYAVSYVGGDGATGTAPSGGEYEQGATFELSNAGTLSKTGYNFGGWSYNGQTYEVGEEFTMPANDVVFSAVWNEKSNSGDEGSTPGDEGSTPGDEGSTPGDEGSTPGDEDTIPENYQVEDNDGLSELDIQLYEDEVEGGYYYYGTLTIKDGDTVEVIGEVNGKAVAIMSVETYDKLGTGSFSDGQLNIAILYDGQYYVFGNATFDSVTITFDPNNGDATWNVKVGVGLYCNMPAATTSSDGKAFINWKATTGATALAGGRFKVSQDVTFVAQYSWVVSFEPGDGATGSVANHTIVEWDSTHYIILPDSTGLTNEGMQFVGWTCDNGETVLPAGTNYYDGTGNMTFTAVWEVAAASDIRTYVLDGTASTDNGRTTKIVIDLTTGNITQTYTNMFGTSTSTEEYTATFEDGKYKVNFSSVGSNVWLVVSEDKQTLNMYDYSTCDDEDLVGTYTLEA